MYQGSATVTSTAAATAAVASASIPALHLYVFLTAILFDLDDPVPIKSHIAISIQLVLATSATTSPPPILHIDTSADAALSLVLLVPLLSIPVSLPTIPVAARKPVFLHYYRHKSEYDLKTEFS